SEFLRILLHGPTGAGKSCFINSVQRILLNRNFIGAHEQTTRSGTSFTLGLKVHRLGGHCPFVFTDIMGLEAEESGGIKPEDVIEVLKGHILDGYTFNPVQSITKDHKKYNKNPKLCDKVHCLVSIVPADNLSIMNSKVIDKMRTIRQKATELAIPQVIVLTKVDQTCMMVNEDLRNISRSKKIKEKECSNILGNSPNSIYPVKNYHAETTQDDDTDALILMALRDIVNFANDHVEDQLGTDNM
uniref:G domain-containing protein n=1 Tax=Pygocentrus nattereri TaxID=42514 RepID=A0A3B4BTC0_PYGNA